VDGAHEQIDRFVRETVAEATALDAASLPASTRLLDANMDSLTLVAIVTRIETAYGTTFDTDEIAELLHAYTVGELVAIVARKVRAAP
jgi:acyl carrier protein